MISMLPVFILPAYAFAFMWILLDVRLREIPRKRLNAALAFLLAVLLCNVAFFVTQGRPLYAKFYFFLIHIPLMIVFSILSRYRGWRVIFVFLTAFISCSFPVIVEGFIRLYRPTGFWDDLIVYTVACALMLVLAKKLFGSAFFYMLEYGEKRYFAKFCVIPLFYFLSTFLMSGRTFQITSAPINLGIKQLPFLFTIFTYYLLLYIFKNTREKLVLQNEQALTTARLSAAEQRMVELKSAQQQAAVYRHDMRHHLSLLDSFAQQGALDKITEYLSQAQQELTAITPMRFCENETVNLILSSFQKQAEKQNAALSVKAELPQVLRLPDTELCSVLSSGLENALHAVDTVEDQSLRRVFVDCRVARNMLLLEIENAYTGTLQMKDELPVSTETGHGYGCRSMRSIAEKRNGFCTFKTEGGVFTLRLVLPLEKEPAVDG
ncbi:sensor histidine kinase [Oscillibacter sp.]|uniref:sensor histidine kinase n=1 Tax=Oscillibacter sp. TaxID=1945593 RepID=UPI0026215F0D|nr:ATP-binding protein [Oscillibacter sp.]MDD3347831.1 ATP-binding protein [Oscillibacter sp.]